MLLVGKVWVIKKDMAVNQEPQIPEMDLGAIKVTELADSAAKVDRVLLLCVIQTHIQQPHTQLT
jgi:hypothetical protein